MFTLGQQSLKNGEDITNLFDGTDHGHWALLQNVNISVVGGSHLFAALMELSELNEP